MGLTRRALFLVSFWWLLPFFKGDQSAFATELGNGSARQGTPLRPAVLDHALKSIRPGKWPLKKNLAATSAPNRASLHRIVTVGQDGF